MAVIALASVVEMETELSHLEIFRIVTLGTFRICVMKAGLGGRSVLSINSPYRVRRSIALCERYAAGLEMVKGVPPLCLSFTRYLEAWDAESEITQVRKREKNKSFFIRRRH